MTSRSPLRTSDDVVAPTLADPLARAATGRVGGPVGRRARAGSGWWTPLRLTLLVATVCFGLGVVQKSPCVVTKWSDLGSPKSFSHMCYSDLSYLYVGKGLAEGVIPYTPADDLPPGKRPTSPDERPLSIEYPVLTGVWMGVTGVITGLVGKAPDVSAVPHSEVGSNEDVQYDSAVFWAVNAVGLYVALLLAVAFLVTAARRRPWDAMYVAAAPVLALSAMINWDLLAMVMVAGFLWAWSNRRPVAAGIFVGLGTAAKLYPLFFLGPLLILCLRERRLGAFVKTTAAALAAWLAVNLPVYLWSPDEFLYFWEFNADRGADFGSLWLGAQIYGFTTTPHTINLVTAVAFGAACCAIAALGLLARRRPRLPQLLFLVVAAFLLVNKVYSPQYVLWLLPLAALARPRWRDLLIWQACEIFYFFAVWMHIANFFVAEGKPDWVYVLAIVVRVAGELYLIGLVVRDILRPQEDPVRADGLSDDPLGGVLDEGIDGEPTSVPASAAHRPDIRDEERRELVGAGTGSHSPRSG